MKNLFYIKYIGISFILIIFLGCSAIKTSIGNNRISDAINIYNSRGTTTDGTLKLISGLDYSPESQVGIFQYQKQYFEITNIKNNILKNRYFSKQDLDTLNLYLLTVEEFKKIHTKFPTIHIDFNDFNTSKVKITKIFEEFVLNDEKLYVTRNQKIQKINFYKKINTYVNSYIINSIILNLENDVTVNLYIGSSFKAFSPLNHLLTNSLVRASNKNINRYLGDYIIFKGFNSFSKPNFKNYFVDFDFISIYIRTLETKKEIKEKEEIFIVRKKISVSGYYKIYNQSPVPPTKFFEFSETYTLKTKKYNNSISYDDEKDILQNILEDRFTKFIHYDLKNLIKIN